MPQDVVILRSSGREGDIVSYAGVPQPGQILTAIEIVRFVDEHDSVLGVGACTLAAQEDIPMIVLWTERGRRGPFSTVHVIHPDGWLGWRSWSDEVATVLRNV